jgi:hypothetical protein
LKSLNCGKNETLNFINDAGIIDEFDARVAMGNSNLTSAQNKQLVFLIDDLLVDCK